MVLDGSGIKLVVGSAKVEFGAAGGKVETEGAGINTTLRDGVVEEGALVEVGYGGVGETKDTGRREATD
jgi:hypothetical protein